MPLVGPLQELVLFVAIPFVGLVDNLVVASFGLHHVLVPKPASPRLQRTFELYPFARELISVHGVFLLCEWRGPGVDDIDVKGRRQAVTTTCRRDQYLVDQLMHNLNAPSVPAALGA